MTTGQHLAHDWYPAPLPGNVRIGERSWLYSSFAFIHFRSKLSQAVEIGSNTGVYNGCFFELGENGSVTIGDYCTVVGAIIACDGPVVINDYAFIAHEVVIADSAFALPPEHRARTLACGGNERRPIRIGRNAWIGARATILAGAEIGEGAIIGAGALVDFEVPDHAIAAGNPGRIVGRVPGAAAGSARPD